MPLLVHPACVKCLWVTVPACLCSGCRHPALPCMLCERKRHVFQQCQAPTFHEQTWLNTVLILVSCRWPRQQTRWYGRAQGRQAFPSVTWWQRSPPSLLWCRPDGPGEGVGGGSCPVCGICVCTCVPSLLLLSVPPAIFSRSLYLVPYLLFPVFSIIIFPLRLLLLGYLILHALSCCVLFVGDGGDPDGVLQDAVQVLLDAGEHVDQPAGTGASGTHADTAAQRHGEAV